MGDTTRKPDCSPATRQSRSLGGRPPRDGYAVAWRRAREAYYSQLGGQAERLIEGAIGAAAFAALRPVQLGNGVRRIALLHAADLFGGRRPWGSVPAFILRANAAGWRVNERTLRNWRQRVDEEGLGGLLRDNRGRGRRRRSIDSKLWRQYRGLRDAGMSRPKARAIVGEVAQAAGLWFPCTTTLQTWRRNGILPQFCVEGAA